jgi:hypothetical protein
MPARGRPTVRSAHVAPLDDASSAYVAHVEGNTRVLESAPGEFDSVTAAVGWARARAAIVILRVAGENHYRSAGDEPPPWDPQMPQWPDA